MQLKDPPGTVRRDEEAPGNHPGEHRANAPVEKGARSHHLGGEGTWWRKQGTSVDYTSPQQVDWTGCRECPDRAFFRRQTLTSSTPPACAHEGLYYIMV